MVFRLLALLPVAVGDLVEQAMLRMYPFPGPHLAPPPVPPGDVLPSWRQAYCGASNCQTVKDVSFAGPHEEAVVAGSDDGRMMIWDKKSGAHSWPARQDRQGLCEPLQ